MTTRTHIDVTQLSPLVDAGYLTARNHPAFPLIIWNYTQRCQYERYWTPETLMCRGLITTPEGEIVARPFPKFFNLDEHQGELPLEPFTVTEKLDGSLGICFFYAGKWHMATRGSFTSEQAIKAQEMLEKYPDLPLLTHRTYLFEIIYPDNRIVVDYGTREDLILLAEIITDTGSEVDIHYPDYREMWSCPIVRQYDGITDIAQLRAIQKENEEGFVIRFQSGLRLKLKFAEYVRLHRLITQVNARVIWDLLRNGQSFDELLDRVPDELYAWVKRTRKELTDAYNAIEGEASAYYIITKHLPTRKEQAAIITQSPYPGVTFAMLDKKDYEAVIWKLLKPSAERPFREDEA